MATTKNIDQPVKLPKVTNKAVSAPAQGINDAGQQVRKPDSASRQTTLNEIRNETDVVAQIRRLADDERFTANAVFSIVQLASTHLQIKGYDQTGAFNQDVVNVANQVIARMDTLSDYTQKFTKKPTLRQFIETALLETALTGAVAAEFVLDKSGIPDHLQAVAYETLTYETKSDNKIFPVQKPSSGDDIPLDIANFFVSELHLSASDTYAVSMYKSCLIDTFQNADFIDDMRRVVNKVGHSRLIVTLDAEKVKATAPLDTQADEKELQAYMAKVQSDVQNAVSGLSPEDSLVVYDNIEANTVDIGGEKSDYVPLMQQLNNMQATSLKAPPSILGIRSEGSQSLSNSETLVYLKIAKSLQGPVRDVLSRALTLAVRLLGVEGYIKVHFDPIELRPDGELEAYRAMKQARVMELLSTGLYTDEMACNELGIPWRADMPKLSGTMFYGGSSQTVDTGEVDNSGGMERTMTSDTPDKAGGASQ